MKPKILVLIFLAICFTSYAQDAVKLEISGPSTCSMGNYIEVTVDIYATAGVQGLNISLYENDWKLFNQLIQTKSAKGDYPYSWQETLIFRFTPKNYESNNTLEVFARVGDSKTGWGGIKSDMISITCK